MPVHGTRERREDKSDATPAHVDAVPAASPVIASTQHLCALTSGVLIFHVLTSVFQESIFHLPGFSNVLLLSFGETLCTTVLVAAQMTWRWMLRRHGDVRMCDAVPSVTLAISASKLQRGVWTFFRRECATLSHIFHPSTVELRWYVCIAMLMSCSLYLTNRSSLLLSYPMQVIFKSSKLLCMVVVRRWWVGEASRTTRSDASTKIEVDEGDEDDGGSGRAKENAVHSSRCDAVLAVDGERDVGNARVPRVVSLHHTTAEAYAHAARPAPRHGSAASAASLASPTTTAEELVRVSVPLLLQPYPDNHPQRHSSAESLVHRGATSRNRQTTGTPGEQRAGVFTVLTPLLCSLRNCRQLHHQLCQPRQCVRHRCLSLAAALRSVQAAVRKSVCSRRGATSLLRAAAPHARAALRDGELQACTVIVLGLILFTYASRVEGLAVTPAAGAVGVAAGSIVDLPLGGVTNVSTTDAAPPQHNTASFSPLTTAAVAFGGVVDTAWSALADAHTLSIVAVVGVAGVLLSNLIDTVIYMLEEIYCFQTTGEVSSAAPAQHCKRGSRTLRRNGSFENGGMEQVGEAGSALPRDCTAAAATAPTAASPTASPSGFPHGVDGGSPERARWLTEADVDVGKAPVGRVPAGLHPSTLPDPPARQRVAEPEEAALTAAVEVRFTSSPTSSSSPSSLPPQRIPAASQEVLLMLNSIATVLYGAGLLLPWLFSQEDGAPTSSLQPAAGAATTSDTPQPFPVLTFMVLIVAASVTSLIGTLCLLSIVATYTGVMAVIVTSLRKTLTILLSFVLYGRRFTVVHAVGLAGVMGGVVWNELLRRQRAHR